MSTKEGTALYLYICKQVGMIFILVEHKALGNIVYVDMAQPSGSLKPPSDVWEYTSSVPISRDLTDQRM
jgi:hypothetical protein